MATVVDQVYRELILYDLDATIVIVPSAAYNEGQTGESLVIERVTGHLSLQASPKIPNGSQGTKIYGILGLIQLRLDRYLIVITKLHSIGRYMSNEIHSVADFQIKPLRLKMNAAIRDPDEHGLLNLLDSQLKSSPLHFSYSLDVTSSLQRRSSSDESEPLWLRADERFFWNHYLVSPLIETSTSQSKAVDKYILPVIYGYFGLRTILTKGHKLTIALISRRSRYRVGTRYFSRGLDERGNASNFNESEQLVSVDNHEVSHVQVRGSVPLQWAEVISLKYKPKLRLFGTPEMSLPLARQHFDQLARTYGDVQCVNLVNSKGHELPIKNSFESLIKLIDDKRVHYKYFDFHTECAGLKWYRIGKLVDQLGIVLENHGYYHSEYQRGRYVEISSQHGVLRSNCMDCLDRTNVVQSAFARWALTKQLRDIGIFSPHEDVATFTELEFLFRGMWADNADVVSKAYSGTGALKTDFTRFGKRTTQGPFLDFSNSAVRYLKNTYFDGLRQDSFDLLMGHYRPNQSRAPVFVDSRSLKIQSIPYILYAAVLMTFAAWVLPRGEDAKLSLRLFVLFWLLVLAWSVQFILAHGQDYVQWPSLLPLEFAPNYPRSNSYEKPKHRDVGKQFKTQLMPQLEDVEMGTTSLTSSIGGKKRHTIPSTTAFMRSFLSDSPPSRPWRPSIILGKPITKLTAPPPSSKAAHHRLSLPSINLHSRPHLPSSLKTYASDTRRTAKINQFFQQRRKSREFLFSVSRGLHLPSISENQQDGEDVIIEESDDKDWSRTSSPHQQENMSPQSSPYLGGRRHRRRSSASAGGDVRANQYHYHLPTPGDIRLRRKASYKAPPLEEVPTRRTSFVSVFGDDDAMNSSDLINGIVDDGGFIVQTFPKHTRSRSEPEIHSREGLAAFRAARADMFHTKCREDREDRINRTRRLSLADGKLDDVVLTTSPVIE